MGDNTAIPVKEDTRERLREIKADKRVSYDELIRELIVGLELDTIEFEGDGQVSTQLGRCESAEKTDEIQEILLSHEEPDEAVERALELVKSAYEQDELLMSHPNTIAASAIYAAKLLMNIGESQESISNKYGTSIATIYKNYRTLLDCHYDNYDR